MTNSLEPTRVLDHDGLSSYSEKYLGTQSLIFDTDNDGLDDREEYVVFQTNPLVADTDLDGYLMAGRWVTV